MTAKDMREFADMQRNRGRAYSLLKAGDKQANLKRAIACYEKALQVYTFDAFPEEWASTQYDMGNAYQDLPGGDRQTNLEQAIACYEKALQVYTPDSEVWAMTQLRLGDAYRDLPAGNRQANLEQASACYQKALQVYTRKDFPVARAMTQFLLGEACRNLPQGDQETNLKRAFIHYQSALQVYTRKAHPKEWAKTQRSLGDLYYSLRNVGQLTLFHPTSDAGSPSGIRDAIFCYQNALQVYTPEDFPIEWARTQYALGNAYGEILGGDRQANLERAINCFQNVLLVHTLVSAPIEWAKTQRRLGSTYRALLELEGDQQAHREQAINCYEKALQVYTHQDFPNEWSAIQNNLNVVKNERKLIRDRLQEAEALRSAGDVQVSWGERTATIESYRQALAIFRQIGERREEARTLCRIGDVQLAMGREQRDAAMQSYGQALALFQQVGDVAGEASALRGMGDADRAAAQESYQRASDLLLSTPPSPEVRRLLATGDTHREAARQSYEQALSLLLKVGDGSKVDTVRRAMADLERLRTEQRDQVQRRLNEKESRMDPNVRRAMEEMRLLHCNFCGAGLPGYARFCGRCGNPTDVSALPTFGHSFHEEERLLDLLASEGQGSATNVPTVPGTPQVGGVPTVKDSLSVPQPAHQHQHTSAHQYPKALTAPLGVSVPRPARRQRLRPGVHMKWLTITIASLVIIAVIIAGVISALAFLRPTTKAAQLMVTPVILDFGMLKKGSKATQTLTVSNAGQQPLSWTADVGTAHWLTVDTSAGTVQPGSLQVIHITANTAQLKAGNYTAMLGINSNGGNTQVPVMLVVVA